MRGLTIFSLLLATSAAAKAQTAAVGNDSKPVAAPILAPTLTVPPMDKLDLSGPDQKKLWAKRTGETPKRLRQAECNMEDVRRVDLGRGIPTAVAKGCRRSMGVDTPMPNSGARQAR